MPMTLKQAGTNHNGPSNPVESRSEVSPEKSGVMFDLTTAQQDYARELLAEGLPRSKVIQMVIEDSGRIPPSKVIVA